MHNRFIEDKKHGSMRGFLFSIIVFAILVVLFLFGILIVSARTDTRQADTLYRAVNRSIVRCYALEGSYPESLDYLKDNYGLTYDESRYYIDYHPIGSNILPDVTIIELEETDEDS